MTLQEYAAKVMATLDDYPSWRLGQTYFNVLADVRPDLSEQIRGGEVDPFYASDGNLRPFLLWIKANWEAK